MLLEYLMDTDQYADELLEKSGIYESVSKRITRMALNAVSEFGQQFIAMVYESPILIFIYENNYVLILLMKFFGKI